MTTPDLHTLTGAYAVDALDPDERRAFEDHLAGCESCREEVLGLRAAAARLGTAAAVGVPESFRDAVLAQVRTTRQLPPPVAADGPDDGRVVALLRRARTTSRALVAVAAALAIIAGALGAVAVRQHSAAVQARQVADQVSAVLAAPDARVATSGGASVVVSDARREAVFVPRDLPAVDADHVLQLWVIDGGARSVGLLDGSKPLLAKDVDPGASLGVTVEPAGGSRQPTTSPVVTVDLKA